MDRNREVDLGGSVTVYRNTQIKCGNCGKIGKLTYMAQHILKCYKDKLDNAIEKRKENQRSKSKDPSYRAKRAVRLKRNDLREDVKEKLGERPEVEHHFYDVPEWHPLYWDRDVITQYDFPIGFRQRLRDAIRDHNELFVPGRTRYFSISAARGKMTN